jgi:SAM-dependent methyltransferase
MRPYLSTRDYNREVSMDTWRYARCEKCGLASMVDVPASLAAYYASGYHTLPATQEAIEASATHERYKIDLVRRFISSGRLLEIGPSWGAFCLLAKRAGFSVEAIEMDPACCEFLEKRIGIRAICRADEAEALEDAAVPDVIAAWHVLEHLRDPWTFLESAARRLAPGGVLVLALPNPQSFQFRVLGRYWAHIDAPRHLHLVPPQVLAARAEALGLKQELCTTKDPGSLGWNTFGWVHSLPHLAGSSWGKRALRFAGQLTSRLAAPIEGREGAGAAYTAVFRKSRRSA